MKLFTQSIFILVLMLLLGGCGNIVTNVQTTFYNEKGDYHYRNHDYRDAFEAYKASAQKGDGYSYYRLFGMYLNGKGLQKNEAIANKMLEEATRLKYPPAEVTTANNLIFTLKNQDVKRGLELLESAASKEYPYAYADLYTIYWNGIGVKKDVQKAGYYYRLAKANGFNPRINTATQNHDSTPNPKQLTTSIQAGLKKLGFYNGQIDGITGPMTNRAISTFQKLYGFPVNTKISPTLLQQIQTKL